MENFKIFLDHLYFSAIAVLGSLIGIYVVLYILDGVLTSVGMSIGFRDVSIGNNTLVISLFWAVVTLGLSGFLTYRTMKELEEPEVDITHRQF